MDKNRDRQIVGEADDLREVFRHVAPYIIRQWKEVCRALGLQELELAQLEVQEHLQSKAYLAYRGLCLWHEHAGKAANRIKLIHALRQCGLYRAEEEIGRLELQNFEKVPSLSRPTSRQTSASRKRPGTGNKETNGYISRPQSRAESAKRTGSAKGHRQPLLLRGVNACELGLKVSVAHIDPVKEFVGVWKEKFNEIASSFYEAVLVNPEIHMTALEHAISMREISVTDIRGGSLHVRFKILTLGALESLYQMYKTRRLHAICRTVFVTENALKTIGAKEVGIKIDLSNEALDKCREFFLTRKFKECVHPTDTLSSPSFDAQPDIEFTTENVHSDNHSGEKVRDYISNKVQKIKERAANFEETIDDFIRTLNIIMPKGQDHIVSLAELLDLYTYLNKTRAVSSGVRVDLFREYLMIVNSIRLITEEIESKLETLLNIDKNLPPDEADDGCSIVQCLVDDLRQMLQPDTIFEEDLSVLNRKISPSEKPFSNLICFIPLLLEKLSTVMSTMTPPAKELHNAKTVKNKADPSKHLADGSKLANGFGTKEEEQENTQVNGDVKTERNGDNWQNTTKEMNGKDVLKQLERMEAATH